VTSDLANAIQDKTRQISALNDTII